MPVEIRELLVYSADINGLKYSATCMENQSSCQATLPKICAFMIVRVRMLLAKG